MPALVDADWAAGAGALGEGREDWLLATGTPLSPHPKTMLIEPPRTQETHREVRIGALYRLLPGIPPNMRQHRGAEPA